MKKLIILMLLLTSCCNVKSTLISDTEMLNSVRYKETFTVKDGLYQGCSFQVLSRHDYFRYDGMVKCSVDDSSHYEIISASDFLHLTGTL